MLEAQVVPSLLWVSSNLRGMSVLKSCSMRKKRVRGLALDIKLLTKPFDFNEIHLELGHTDEQWWLVIFPRPVLGKEVIATDASVDA